MPENPTRQRLLEAATALLARSGYRALGISELLAAARATAGSLYHHFPGGKEELAAVAIREAGAAGRAALAGLLASAPPADAIRAFFSFSADSLEGAAWQLGCPVGTPAADGAAVSPAIAGAVTDSLASWVEAIATALAERGVAPAAAREFGEWAIAAYEGAMLVARARGESGVLHTAAGRLATEVERLLGGAARG